MKNNLGFPASDLHLSPLNGATRSSKGTVPSVPYTTPSSPWLRIQKTKASESVWSSRDPEIPCQKHSVLLAIITLIRSVKNIFHYKSEITQNIILKCVLKVQSNQSPTALYLQFFEINKAASHFIF